MYAFRDPISSGNYLQFNYACNINAAATISGLTTINNQLRATTATNNVTNMTYTGTAQNVNILTLTNNSSNATPYLYTDFMCGADHYARLGYLKESATRTRFTIGMQSSASAPWDDMITVYRDVTASGNTIQFKYPCNFDSTINANSYTGNISTLNMPAAKGRNLSDTHKQNLMPIGQSWDSTNLRYIKNTYQTTTYGNSSNYIVFNKPSLPFSNSSYSPDARKFNYYAFRVRNASTDAQILSNFKFGISSYPVGATASNFQNGMMSNSGSNIMQFLFLSGFIKNTQFYYGYNDLTNEYSNQALTSILEADQYTCFFGWSYDYATYRVEIFMKMLNEATNTVTYSASYAIPNTYLPYTVGVLNLLEN
jgi:hypothetical protein